MDKSLNVKVGNLVTDMHNVLNRYYSNDNDKKKAIRNIVKKIFEAGYSEGYKMAGYDIICSHPVYDEYGSVKESNVKFAIVNSYDYDDYEVFEEGLSPEQMYILTRDNMPQRIWRIKRSSGERVEI